MERLPELCSSNMRKSILINWLVEFGPLVTFFTLLFILDPVGKNPKGFIFSTGVFVVLTLIAILVGYIKDKSTTLFPLIAALAIVSFGTATVIFKNPMIFIIKDTVYNGLFSVFLFGGVIISGKGFLKPLFRPLFDMQDRGWYILSIRWALMFLILAVLNEIIWRGAIDWWVRYKFLATLATFIFGFYQFTLARKYRNPSASPWGMRIDNKKI